MTLLPPMAEGPGTAAGQMTPHRKQLQSFLQRLCTS